MSDLVERLRHVTNCGIPDFTNSKLLDEAAARIEALEAVCMRDRFADGYAAGCKDFQTVGGKRIEALEAVLWTIRLQNVEPYCREIARTALNKDVRHRD